MGVPSSQAPASRDRAEQLVEHRVDDHANGRLTTDDEAHAGAEMGDAGSVVHGAVERVDDPDPMTGLDRRAGAGPVDGPSPGTRPGVAGFLGQDLVVREGFAGWSR